jgi:hypothetical protein
MQAGTQPWSSPLSEGEPVGAVDGDAAEGEDAGGEDAPELQPARRMATASAPPVDILVEQVPCPHIKPQSSTFRSSPTRWLASGEQSQQLPSDRSEVHRDGERDHGIRDPLPHPRLRDYLPSVGEWSSNGDRGR